jgi:hypothetical protein
VCTPSAYSLPSFFCYNVPPLKFCRKFLHMWLYLYTCRHFLWLLPLCRLEHWSSNSCTLVFKGIRFGKNPPKCFEWNISKLSSNEVIPFVEPFDLLLATTWLIKQLALLPSLQLYRLYHLIWVCTNWSHFRFPCREYMQQSPHHYIPKCFLYTTLSTLDFCSWCDTFASLSICGLAIFKLCNALSKLAYIRSWFSN